MCRCNIFRISGARAKRAAQVYKRAGALPMARAQLLLMVDLVLANVITMDVLLGMVSTTDHSVESFGDGAPPLIAEAETCVRLGDLPAEYDDILKVRGRLLSGRRAASLPSANSTRSPRVIGCMIARMLPEEIDVGGQTG